MFQLLSLWCFTMAALVNSYKWEGVSQVKEVWGVGRRGEEEKSRKKNGLCQIPEGGGNL